MRWIDLLKFELSVLGALLLGGGLVGWATGAARASDAPGYEVIRGADLEPFRSAFNANADHVRLVLLVGPT